VGVESGGKDRALFTLDAWAGVKLAKAGGRFQWKKERAVEKVLTHYSSNS
jgi:hypothetical protein